MNESPTADDPDDLLIAEVLAQAAVGGNAALLEGIGRHPRLAARLVELHKLQRSLESARRGDSLSPGERLGDFHILRKVGGGGMGEVYEAEQVSLGGRRVALKVMRHDRATDELRERFRREQRILARLHQTHIVPIHVAGEDRGLHYLVMPFIDGAALHDVIAAVRRQPSGPASTVTALIEEAVKHRSRGREAMPPAGEASRPRLAAGYYRLVAGLMADVAEAVEAVHQAGFLHRDLKPGNLMVDRQGKVWIIDFGLACEVTEVTAAAAKAEGGSEAPPREVSCIAGTPQYMAPEQRAGKADRRSDVWALGATLYELANLQRAAEREETGAKGATRVPADLAAICERALQEEPGRRYATAGELGRDLRRWLAHEPTVARGATVWRWAWLLIRRYPERASAMAGVGLALALAVFLGVVFLQKRAAEERERWHALISQVEGVRLGTRQPGWSNKGWKLVQEAAHLRIGEPLRHQASATLIGLDVRPLLRLDNRSTSSVAFDPAGNRILIGGWDSGAGQAEHWHAEVWDQERGKIVYCSNQKGPGPVAFRTDGTPVQLLNPSQAETRSFRCGACG